ncbi:hypothetical protein M1D55_07485 [Cupriavidus sp. JZ107]
MLITGGIPLGLVGCVFAHNCYAKSYGVHWRVAIVSAVLLGLAATVAAYRELAHGAAWRRKTAAVACFGAILGFIVGFIWSEALPAFTASGTRVYTVAFTQTDGWRNCAFGTRFRDANLGSDITLCGAKWGLPRSASRGYVQVTERVGRFGVQLNEVVVIDTSPH